MTDIDIYAYKINVYTYCISVKKTYSITQKGKINIKPCGLKSQNCSQDVILDCSQCFDLNCNQTDSTYIISTLKVNELQTTNHLLHLWFAIIPLHATPHFHADLTNGKINTKPYM